MATVPFPLYEYSPPSNTKYLIGIGDDKDNLIVAVNPAKIVAIVPDKSSREWELYVNGIDDPILLTQSQAERLYQQLGQG